MNKKSSNFAITVFHENEGPLGSFQIFYNEEAFHSTSVEKKYPPLNSYISPEDELYCRSASRDYLLCHLLYSILRLAGDYRLAPTLNKILNNSSANFQVIWTLFCTIFRYKRDLKRLSLNYMFAHLLFMITKKEAFNNSKCKFSRTDLR